MRQHLVVPEVVIAGGEVELIELELESELLGGRLEDAHALGNDFPADSVTGDDGDFVGPVF